MRDDPRDAEPVRLPPHSLEAEQMVLGAMLLDPSAVDRVADLIAPEDFYSDAHRRIHATIRDLALHGQPVDTLTVAERLQAAGALDAVGGLPYLGSLAQAVPSTANAAHYAGIVRDRSIRRKVAALAAEVAEKAYARSSGQEVLEELTAGAHAIAEFGTGDDATPLSDLAPEVVAELERRQEAKDPPGISTGLSDLDGKIVGLQAGQLLLVAGRPSSGKTALGLQFAVHAAIALGKPALYFSLEMRPREIAERAIANVGQVNAHAMRVGRLEQEDWSRVSHAIGKISAGSPLLIDGAPRLTIERIRSRARRAHRRIGLSLVVVDYLQLIEGMGDEDSRHEAVSTISRGLKLLANELDVPVVALSQLNRKVEDRTNKRPMLSDLRDSGALEQDADVVLMVYREEVYRPDDEEVKGKAEIIVAKQRNGEIGTVFSTFIGAWSRFADTTWRPTPGASRKGKARADLDE